MSGQKKQYEDYRDDWFINPYSHDVVHKTGLIYQPTDFPRPKDVVSTTMKYSVPWERLMEGMYNKSPEEAREYQKELGREYYQIWKKELQGKKTKSDEIDETQDFAKIVDDINTEHIANNWKKGAETYWSCLPEFKKAMEKRGIDFEKLYKEHKRKEKENLEAIREEHRKYSEEYNKKHPDDEELSDNEIKIRTIKKKKGSYFAQKIKSLFGKGKED